MKDSAGDQNVDLSAEHKAVTYASYLKVEELLALQEFITATCEFVVSVILI